MGERDRRHPGRTAPTDLTGVSHHEAHWWAIRPAQNLSASVYRCPLCDERLPALTEHLLITPEGDSSRRRHAHTDCVLQARREGRLPIREERQDTLPPSRAWWKQVWKGIRRR